ncbi:MAG: hypothetical protein MRZ79_10885 [Bacteroidia bacterium]|nr:hypothetical protein [Bacteroidia bacterium]
MKIRRRFKPLYLIPLFISLFSLNFLQAQQNSPRVRTSIHLGTNPNFLGNIRQDISVNEAINNLSFETYNFLHRGTPLFLGTEVLFKEKFALRATLFYARNYAFLIDGDFGLPSFIGDKIYENYFHAVNLIVSGRYYQEIPSWKLKFYGETGIEPLSLSYSRGSTPYNRRGDIRNRSRIFGADIRPAFFLQTGAFKQLNERYSLDIGGNLRKIPFNQGLKFGITASIALLLSKS